MKNWEKVFLGICILFVLIGSIEARWEIENQIEEKEALIKRDKELFILCYMEGHVDGAVAGMRAVKERDLDVYFKMAKEDSVKFVNSHTVK